MDRVFEWPIRVYYEDTDHGGIVYYANYLKFIERARTELLLSLGFTQTKLANDYGIGFSVREANIIYHRPCVFEEDLVVKTRVNQLKAASMIFSQNIHHTASDQIRVEATIRLACVQLDPFRPAPIPKEVSTKLKFFLANEAPFA